MTSLREFLPAPSAWGRYLWERPDAELTRHLVNRRPYENVAHDAGRHAGRHAGRGCVLGPAESGGAAGAELHHHGASGAADRKSTRLNSSHLVISYAVFCLKKKKK